MRVHVISLRQSAARRASLQSRLDSLGVDYSVTDAVDGRAGYAYFDACDERRYLLNTGHRPSAGEVGCYASHLRLWQLCVTSERPLVIMEDDAAPEANFAAALATTHVLVPRFGFIRLEYDGPGHPARTRQVAAAGEFTIHYFVKYPYGAMCYALSPAVAQALIAASRVLRAPVDLFIKRCWEHGQPLFGLLPYSIKESPHALASTIRSRNASGALAIRTQRLTYKLETSIRRAAFNRRWLQRMDEPQTGAAHDR